MSIVVLLLGYVVQFLENYNQFFYHFEHNDSISKCKYKQKCSIIN